MSWLNIVLTVLSIFIPVFATIYTVNSRIKNENRENHMPFIVLDKIESLRKLDESSYYLTPVGKNFRENNPNFVYESISKKNATHVKFRLKNIGYGVATNVRFYDLGTGETIYGTQASNKEKNQKLFTTFDIASSETNKVQAKIISHVDKIKKGIVREDNIKLLCVYKDLNENCYDFIININIKGNGYYDFFAYQRSSRSYIRWIKENKKRYEKIIKNYLNK